MNPKALKQIEYMCVDTVQPLATIVVAPFPKDWDPSVPFSTPRYWNSSRLLLIIMWEIFKNISY